MQILLVRGVLGSQGYAVVIGVVSSAYTTFVIKNCFYMSYYVYRIVLHSFNVVGRSGVAAGMT